MHTLTSMLRLAWQAHPPSFLGLILLTALQGLIPLATAWITKLIFDLVALAWQESSPAVLFQNLLPLLFAQAAVLVFSQIITPAHGFLNVELGRKLTLLTETVIYRKISSFTGIAYFENPQFYDTFRLASQGARIGPLQSLHILTSLLQSAVTLAAFLGTLVAFSPVLAGLVVGAALPQLGLQLKFGRQRFGLAFEVSPDERRAFYESHLLSSADAAKEIRLFRLSNFLIERLLQTYQKIHRAQRRQELHELRWQVPLEGLSASVFSIAFAVAALQAFARRLSLGDLTLFINAVRSLQSALSAAISALADMHVQALFFKNYHQLLAMKEPVQAIRPAYPVAALDYGIELRNVSFRYTPQHPWVLRNFNLFIPAGKSLALVGLNGAGKTTLVKLLTRLYDPVEGEILWDGIDIRAFDPEDLRRRIGVIFQDFIRYAFTAQENIGLGDIEHLEDSTRVCQAAAKAGVDATIQNLPLGYQTLLSRAFGQDRAGVDLSGGEWQKVALARMFMRDADFLILDEPTASLDAQAEHELYSRFTELVKRRTCLLISHRFSTVRMAETIAVLEDGKITEIGSHDSLCSLEGAYARLYNMQISLGRMAFVFAALSIYLAEVVVILRFS